MNHKKLFKICSYLQISNTDITDGIKSVQVHYSKFSGISAKCMNCVLQKNETAKYFRMNITALLLGRI